jgi:hypothetical protein
VPNLLPNRSQTLEQGINGSSRRDVVRLGRDCRRIVLAFEVVAVAVEGVSDVVVGVDDVVKKHVGGSGGWLLALGCIESPWPCV